MICLKPAYAYVLNKTIFREAFFETGQDYLSYLENEFIQAKNPQAYFAHFRMLNHQCTRN